MITRSQMRRQLRAQGGIMSVEPRTGFFLGGIKKRIRKIIPNELADVAVKAAPFVAMIPGYGPAAAAAMRGIGRFDQRGSISDALKQGALTYGGGKLFGAGMERAGFRDPGASGIGQFFNEGTRGSIGNFFRSGEKAGDVNKFKGPRRGGAGPFPDGGTTGTPIPKKGLIETGTDFLSDKVPGFGKLDQIVQEKLLVGGVTGAATYLYEKFLGDEPPQDEGETYEQYMARRKENVGRKMRTYMDNYFANDPEYMQLDDAGRDAFVERYNVRDGGRIGYQTGGISSANTLQQNIAANRQQAAGIQTLLNQARTSAGLPTVQAPAQTTAAPAQTTAAAPAPSITKSTSAPTQAAPTTQQIASAMLSSGNPMASSSQSTGMGSLLSQLPQQIVSGVGGRPMGFNPPSPSQLPNYFKYFNTTGANVDPSTYDPNTDSYLVPDPSTGVFQTITGPFDKYGVPVSFRPAANVPEGIVGNYGPGGMRGSVIQGKFYPSEEAAIDGLGIEVYNQFMADGGRVGFSEGGTGFMKWLKANKGMDVEDIKTFDDYADLVKEFKKEEPDSDRELNAGGGISGIPMGQPRVNQGGITELDYRAKGGFVPVGIKEKADDVPAMLSKNEFVFTADAVRGAGNGSVEKGAQKMYDTMKNLERRVT